MGCARPSEGHQLNDMQTEKTTPTPITTRDELLDCLGKETPIISKIEMPAGCFGSGLLQ